MLTDADIQRIRDDLRIQRLQRLAANMRRAENNGSTRAAAKRDAERRERMLRAVMSARVVF
jgi:hypothetical protein